MFEKTRRFLKQPYIQDHSPVQSIVIATLIVLFVLGLFRPFGIQNLQTHDFIGTLLFSALGTILGILCTFYIVPRLFPRFYTPDHWTIGKQIFQQFIVAFVTGIIIGTGGALFYIGFNTNFSLEVFLKIFTGLFLAVLLVFPIPSVILLILLHNRNLTIHLKEAQKMNEQLMRKTREQVPQTNENNPSIILSGTTKESLEVNPDRLLYIEAYGNYIKIYYIEKDTVKQKSLRATIKQAEDSFPDYPYIVRCHRAFIVNTNNILGIKGNSQGYRLAFKHTPEEIPVSRAYTKTLKSLLN